MNRTHLIAVLVGLVAIAAFAPDAHARYYQVGVNVYPAVATPMPPAPMPPVAIAVPGRMHAPMPTGFDRPHVGVNVYPGIPSPMPHPDGPNLYQYVRSNPIGNLDPTGLSTKCGTLYLTCKTGVKPWDVYGCSNRAKWILGGERGCVTLLLPKAIFCTGSCEDIKGWVSTGNPSIKLLDHEACHACAFEDKGLLEYLRTWIPGDIESPKYCDRHPMSSTCNW